MSTENPDMWAYWRDRVGTEAALTDYYPCLLAEDPYLRHALSNYIQAKNYINLRMAEHAMTGEVD